MARPQRISNADILQAARMVLEKLGPQQLTLEAVGQKVSLVPGTLMQRFGSKRGLLLALARSSQTQIATIFNQARSQHSKPLKALESACVNLYQDLNNPLHLSHHLAFLQWDLQDQEFLSLSREYVQILLRELEHCLKAAVEQGELSPAPVKPRALHVYYSLQGCLLHWTLLQPESLPRTIRRTLQTTLLAWKQSPTVESGKTGQSRVEASSSSPSPTASSRTKADKKDKKKNRKKLKKRVEHP